MGYAKVDSITGITSTSATINTAFYGTNITENSLYYKTSSNPFPTGTKVIVGNTYGNYQNTLTGLSPNTTYYLTAVMLSEQDGITSVPSGGTAFTTLP